MDYKIINGTSYSKQTPDEIISILEDARQSRKRIRIFYGDPDTGRDWMESHDTCGFIGRSCGNVKTPIMLSKPISYGGCAILDDHIIRITIEKKNCYINKNYYLPELCFKAEIGKYPFMVFADGKRIAAFSTQKEAENFIDFIKGNRNVR